jgi:hypothetical protein
MVRVRNGTAILGLGSGRQLELREGTVVRLSVQQGSAGGSETRAQLDSGDLLVTASGDPATVVAADSTIQVTGAARVSRSLAVVAAVYDGAAGVESGGRSVSVPALRQVTVPAPGLPSRATPLAFSTSDSWDQRYLGDAIDLGNQLVARSRGFTAQLAPAQGTVELFRQIMPGLAGQPLDAAAVAAQPPGETLIGAGITVEGTKGTFANRWESVFSFHNEGAPWGLVALDQGVSRVPLLATVDAAIVRLVGPTAPAAAPAAPSAPRSTPPPVPVPTTPPAGAGEGAGSQTGPAASGTGTGGGTGTATGTGTAVGNPPPATPLPERGPVDLGIPVVDETANSVIETLSGLLRAIGQP